MDVKKSVLVSSIVGVFLIGLIVGSFTGLNNAVTGQVSRRDRVTTISVNPIEVEADGTLTINVVPGSKGAERYVYFYTIGEIGQLRVRRDISQKFCSHNNICYEPETFEYKISSLWSPGRYAATVTDVLTGEKVRAVFEVGYEKPKGHA